MLIVLELRANLVVSSYTLPLPCTRLKDALYLPGARKVRCSGEIPVCSKCVATKRKCVYSIQKRAGRPRTRQNTSVTSREGSSPMHLEEHQLSSAVSPARTTATTYAIEENECSHHEALVASIPPYVTDYESNMP